MRALLSDAIEDWLRFRRSQDIAVNTIKGNATVVRRFLTITGNIYCDKITEHHVTKYFEVASKTKQPQSLRNDHGILSVFFDWCRHTKRMSIEQNPLYGRRMPKQLRRERNRLNVSEFPCLLDAAEARSPRDRAAVAILLYTLLRDRDAADLRVADVDLEGGWLRARIHKTGLEDRMPITTELDYELRKWLTAYTEEVGPLKNHYYLLPQRLTHFAKGNNGGVNVEYTWVTYPEKPIGPLGKTINPILESIGFPIQDHTGAKTYEGAHTIRRSGARALFDHLVSQPAEERNGDPLRIVQSMLHHKHVTQTEDYIGVQPDRRTRDEVLRGRSMYGRTATVTSISQAR